MAIHSVTTTEESLEWLNGNMHRNYPIVDNTIVKSMTGEYLPSSFLVDIQLVVPYVEGIDSSNFFISSIVRNASSFQVTIGYMISGASEELRHGFDCAVSAAIPVGLEYTGPSYARDHVIKLSAITTAATFTESSYTYGIPDEYAALKDIRGTIYIGTCTDMANISAMQFAFDASAILPACVFVESKEDAIKSVSFIDDNGVSDTFTEDIVIRLGEGILAEVSDDKSSVTLTLDPAYLSNQINSLFRSSIGTAIKKINGQGPDENGNFQIAGLDCTLIDSDSGTNSIKISNPCAKPCCDQGGEDSAEVLNALSAIAQAKEVLNNYYTDLATKVNSMQARLASLIASRK